ncbi:hypothetical protein AK812_SmicGene12936 [Symbiodinium microadriaticum]|uniref:Uncharacterized protein n=1 Tax=Symbiodinium microadriaticum TaxID=2951 RepID=A0A1Q9E9C8_SYMMI|nr:hypothetical protein AK812_SmicGene12936 [Symbiodinium microadriaticum]
MPSPRCKNVVTGCSQCVSSIRGECSPVCYQSCEEDGHPLCQALYGILTRQICGSPMRLCEGRFEQDAGEAAAATGIPVHAAATHINEQEDEHSATGQATATQPLATLLKSFGKQRASDAPPATPPRRNASVAPMTPPGPASPAKEGSHAEIATVEVEQEESTFPGCSGNGENDQLPLGRQRDVETLQTPSQADTYRGPCGNTVLHDVGTVVPTNESCERDEDPATTAMRDVRALLDVLTEHFAEPQDGQRLPVGKSLDEAFAFLCGTWELDNCPGPPGAIALLWTDIYTDGSFNGSISAWAFAGVDHGPIVYGQTPLLRQEDLPPSRDLRFYLPKERLELITLRFALTSTRRSALSQIMQVFADMRCLLALHNPSYDTICPYTAKGADEGETHRRCFPMQRRPPQEPAWLPTADIVPHLFCAAAPLPT